MQKILNFIWQAINLVIAKLFKNIINKAVNQKFWQDC